MRIIPSRWTQGRAVEGESATEGAAESRRGDEEEAGVPEFHPREKDKTAAPSRNRSRCTVGPVVNEAGRTHLLLRVPDGGKMRRQQECFVAPIAEESSRPLRTQPAVTCGPCIAKLLCMRGGERDRRTPLLRTCQANSSAAESDDSEKVARGVLPRSLGGPNFGRSSVL